MYEKMNRTGDYHVNPIMPLILKKCYDEYQEVMTSWQIPLFEGRCTVEWRRLCNCIFFLQTSNVNLSVTSSTSGTCQWAPCAAVSTFTDSYFWPHVPCQEFQSCLLNLRSYKRKGVFVHVQIYTFFLFLKKCICHFFSNIIVTCEMFDYSSELVRIRVGLLQKRKLWLRKIHGRWFMLCAEPKFISSRK